MSRVIYKYPLTVQDTPQLIRTGGRALPLHFDYQHDGLCVWVEQDREGHDALALRVLATGETIPPGTGSYIGTVLVRELVWHLYSAFQRAIAVPMLDLAEEYTTRYVGRPRPVDCLRRGEPHRNSVFCCECERYDEWQKAYRQVTKMVKIINALPGA